MTSVFSSTPIQSSASQSNRNAKTILVRRLALMCCRDLSPFSIVEKPGFSTFLLQTGVIRDLDDLPTPEAVSRGGLNNIYETTLDAVKQLIETSQGIVAITTDMWTDNYRRRSYIAFTLHFCNKEYELQSLTLKTVLFEGAHTGENIKREMEATAKEFGFDSKKTIYVTDNGSNIVKACNLAKVEWVFSLPSSYLLSLHSHSFISCSPVFKCFKGPI